MSEADITKLLAKTSDDARGGKHAWRKDKSQDHNPPDSSGGGTKPGPL